MCLGKGEERTSPDLCNKAFDRSWKKIECEIEQVELVLENLLVAVIKDNNASIDQGSNETISGAADATILGRLPRISDFKPLASAVSLILTPVAPTVVASG